MQQHACRCICDHICIASGLSCWFMGIFSLPSGEPCIETYLESSCSDVRHVLGGFFDTGQVEIEA